MKDRIDCRYDYRGWTVSLTTENGRKFWVTRHPTDPWALRQEFSSTYDAERYIDERCLRPHKKKSS